MTHNTPIPLVITISRELGSGGAYIGHQLAEQLEMLYVDHEIIARTAEKLDVLEHDVSSYEEKISSFWANFWEKTKLNEFYNEATSSFRPTTAKIFEAEAEVMRQIAKERPAVIIGRGGFHVLKDFPNVVSIYLHGSIQSRSQRLMQVRHIDELEAKRQIEVGDRERTMYIRKFTKKDWANSNNFDLTLDTGKVSLECATDIILRYVAGRKPC